MTYILPIRRDRAGDLGDLPTYLRSLAALVEVIVVDGSAASVFADTADALGPSVRHLLPQSVTPNGKVGNVRTGIEHARHDRLIIADDDVRYDPASLRRLVALLDHAEVVRPQNYFDPLPWHARWDTARSLLNRTTGGDWPGTLAVRRSVLMATGGYAGDVLFENLELVRTVRAAGGREMVAPDLFVRRSPPDARHFWSQRVRQAYDELARPWRMALFLALLPAAVWLAMSRQWRVLACLGAASIGLAEMGRQRAGGAAVFPASSSLLAPAWLLERAVCSWLALVSRVRHGGVRYRGQVIRRAANSQRTLDRLHGRSHRTPGAKAAPVSEQIDATAVALR